MLLARKGKRIKGVSLLLHCTTARAQTICPQFRLREPVLRALRILGMRPAGNPPAYLCQKCLSNGEKCQRFAKGNNRAGVVARQIYMKLRATGWKAVLSEYGRQPEVLPVTT